MTKYKKYLFTAMVSCCFVISGCLQTKSNGNLKSGVIFYGSTPADEFVRSVLKIEDKQQVDFIRWTLLLDTVAGKPRTFTLDIVFGKAQQNTPDFLNGGQTRAITGSYSLNIEKQKGGAETYHLQSNGLSKDILLRKINDNILHILTPKQVLAVGNAGYSYTLNSLNPNGVTITQASLPQSSVSQLNGAKVSSRVFVGRTPCNDQLLNLNGVPAADCQRIKWELTLLQDPQSRQPTTFQLKSIYVGTGNVVYLKTGNWKVGKGIKSNPGAIVYILQPSNAKAKDEISFMQGDENILFLLDKDKDLLVGNGDQSYTLNLKSN